MKKLIGNALEELGENFLGGIREAADNRLDNEFFYGYDAAANICTESITKRIDELHKQINDGTFLNNQEQFLLAQLNELKREIEDRLRKFDNKDG